MKKFKIKFEKLDYFQHNKKCILYLTPTCENNELEEVKKIVH
jgi:2'-5' RNA ligase